jgi:hypothetical protein
MHKYAYKIYLSGCAQARIEEALMRERLLAEELGALQERCAEQVQKSFTMCVCVCLFRTCMSL